MSYKKVLWMLVILSCLHGNIKAIAPARVISCRADQVNQRFICLDEAVSKIKDQVGNYIYVVGYGSSRRTPCTGKRIAQTFRRQLIDDIKKQGNRVDERLFQAIDGGYRDDAWIEVYSGGQPSISAKWPPNCSK